uniref:40S ribosomal protein S25 n=1 Tax=Parastrongyloides trichosuri TaxID=131310 RepID=A0A0N4Z6L8_PARTI
MSKTRGSKSVSNRKGNTRKRIAKKGKVLYNPISFKPQLALLPAIADKPKIIVKRAIRKLILPKDVKTKVFENLRGKHLRVDPSQLEELIKKRVDTNVEENILGFQPLLMLKQRYKELCKIHCEELSRCVRGAWFKQGRYGATFLPPGHF